ncbi:hypothetical protein YC2023_046194 [Brassica napus]
MASTLPWGRTVTLPPSQGKMEWRPVTRPRETEESSGTQRLKKEAGNNRSPMEQSKTESSTVLRTQREANASTKNSEPLGEPEMEKENEQTRSHAKVPEIARHGLTHDPEKETMEAIERRKKDKEKEDAELERSIDEYAEMAMNEEMIDADDLLDENFENEERLGEEGREEEEEQIEAIAQLSQNRSTRPPIGEKIKEKSMLQLRLNNQFDGDIHWEPFWIVL